MLELILSKIKAKYQLKEVDVGSYRKIDKSGLHFLVEAYDVKGVGRLSIMTMKGMLGLMKMETVILTSNEIDMPILSYDLVNAMGKITFLLEAYDTCFEKMDVEGLDAAKNEYESLKDGELKPNWYDSIRLSPSLKKVGKKKDIARMNELCDKWIESFISAMEKAKPTDKVEKTKKNKEYVDGLLNNGGPSTDMFKKMIGEKETAELFNKYLFGIE